MRKKIELICPHCEKVYKKDLSEYNRNEKLVRKSYCSLSCSSLANKTSENLTPYYDIDKHSNNRADEFTPFRYTMKNLKKRSKKENKLSLQDLKDLWEKQNGVCPYSGVSMVLPTHSNTTVPHDVAASLDRINSSLGYQVGNVQFVVRAINLMKNTMTHEQTVQFLQTITNHYKN